MNQLPPGRLLFDTSAYVRYFRQSKYSWLKEDQEVVGRTILTVVVAAELYAGARGPEDKRELDRLCQGHRTLDTLSFPSSEAWLHAGQLLGRYIRLYGSLRVADHFRDVLIALEAVKNKATLVTENARDFARWRNLLRSAGQHLEFFDLGKFTVG